MPNTYVCWKYTIHQSHELWSICYWPTCDLFCDLLLFCRNLQWMCWARMQLWSGSTMVKERPFLLNDWSPSSSGWNKLKKVDAFRLCIHCFLYSFVYSLLQAEVKPTLNLRPYSSPVHLLRERWGIVGVCVTCGKGGLSRSEWLVGVSKVHPHTCSLLSDWCCVWLQPVASQVYVLKPRHCG